ncbi:MAG: hypothetical protein K9H25_17335 [Rhodospirillum sp.]|nr:hypothetical protein [Rhodospirillum sp.]MCF8502883.1 hypothetical protein [Rhodospirillum sp.]
MIEQFLGLLLPRKLVNWLDSRFPKERRKTFLLLLCVGAFLYASFMAYDDVNKRLRVSQEQLLRHAGQSGTVFEYLDEDQVRALSTAFSTRRGTVNSLVVGWYLTPSAILFSTSVVDAIKRAGIVVTEVSIAPDAPDQVGVMLSCLTPDTPPPMAAWLIESFQELNIRVNVIGPLRGGREYIGDGCMLFVGPGPFFEVSAGGSRLLRE